MGSMTLLLVILAAMAYGSGVYDEQDMLGWGADPNKYKAACPDYRQYSMVPQYVLL